MTQPKLCHRAWSSSQSDASWASLAWLSTGRGLPLAASPGHSFDFATWLELGDHCPWQAWQALFQPLVTWPEVDNPSNCPLFCAKALSTLLRSERRLMVFSTNLVRSQTAFPSRSPLCVLFAGRYTNSARVCSFSEATQLVSSFVGQWNSHRTFEDPLFPYIRMAIWLWRKGSNLGRCAYTYLKTWDISYHVIINN